MPTIATVQDLINPDAEDEGNITVDFYFTSGSPATRDEPETPNEYEILHVMNQLTTHLYSRPWIEKWTNDIEKSLEEHRIIRQAEFELAQQMEDK